jgi:hypothetical protein
MGTRGLVIAAMLVALVGAPAWAQVQLSVSPASVTQDPLVDFTVGLHVNDATDIISFAFAVSFDDAILEFTGAELGALTSNWSFLVPNASPGLAEVAALNGVAIAGGTGTLVELGFRVRETATAGQFSPLRIESALLNSGLISATTSDGQVVVSTTPPVAFVDLAPGQSNFTNDDPVYFRVGFTKAIDPDTFDVADLTIGGTLGGTVTSILASSPTAYEVEVSLAGGGDGTVNLQVHDGATITDTAGNALTAASNVSPTVTIDRSVPHATVGRVSPIENPTQQTSATFAVGGEGVSLFRYQLDDGLWSPEQPVTGSLTINNLSVGEHTVKVIGGDLAGNWQNIATPTVSSAWTVLAFVSHTSVVVPFFFDTNAPTKDGTGVSTFIAVTNRTDEAKTMHIYYHTDNGTNVTPVNNTVVIGAHATFAWRPVANDIDAEGVLGASVPDATSALAANCIITVEGSPGDLTGRVISTMGGASGSQSAYTLPVVAADTPAKAFPNFGGGEKADPVDSDGDGVLDTTEVANGSDPYSKADTPGEVELLVPLFVDSIPAGDTTGPGLRTFIGVLNTTDHSLAVTVEYYSEAGEDSTPEENFFVVTAGQSVSWRPTTNEPLAEGANGAAVPDAAVGSPVATNHGGNAVLRFFGNPGDLVGRVITLSNNAANSQSAYAIPVAE